MEWAIKEISVSTSTCCHAAAVCDGKLYMHGGVKSYPSTSVPLNEVSVFDPENLTLQAVQTNNQGPSRSHHTAVALNDRTICIVGGWDGKKRTADVWLFDVVELTWKLCEPTAQSNSPSGLSSHTCTVINESEMIITGREGGVRMQRRFGSVFKLNVDVRKSCCAFREMPDHIASRSGHTSCLVVNKLNKKSGSLVIVGGRDSMGADLLHFASSQKPCYKDLSDLLHKAISDKNAVVSNRRKALRHHAGITAGDLCLVHGGEIFGKARDNVTPDLYVHDATATRWWTIDIPSQYQSMLTRMGHSVAWLHQKLYVVGGVHSQRGRAASTVIEMQPLFKS